MSERVTLLPVDAADVTILIDNFIDILPHWRSLRAYNSTHHRGVGRYWPSIIVPGHCTVWKATHELARQLPDAYVQTSVGTRLHFG